MATDDDNAVQAAVRQNHTDQQDTDKRKQDAEPQAEAPKPSQSQHLEHTEGKPNPCSAADATEASTPLPPVEAPHEKAEQQEAAPPQGIVTGTPTPHAEPQAEAAKPSESQHLEHAEGKPHPGSAPNATEAATPPPVEAPHEKAEQPEAAPPQGIVTSTPTPHAEQQAEAPKPSQSQHLEHTEGKPNPCSAADATEASTPLPPVEAPHEKAEQQEAAPPQGIVTSTPTPHAEQQAEAPKPSESQHLEHTEGKPNPRSAADATEAATPPPPVEAPHEKAEQPEAAPPQGIVTSTPTQHAEPQAEAAKPSESQHLEHAEGKPHPGSAANATEAATPPPPVEAPHEKAEQQEAAPPQGIVTSTPTQHAEPQAEAAKPSESQRLEHTEGKPNPGSAADATEASAPPPPVEAPHEKAEQPEAAPPQGIVTSIPTQHAEPQAEAAKPSESQHLEHAEGKPHPGSAANATEAATPPPPVEAPHEKAEQQAAAPPQGIVTSTPTQHAEPQAEAAKPSESQHLEHTEGKPRPGSAANATEAATPPPVEAPHEKAEQQEAAPPQGIVTSTPTQHAEPQAEAAKPSESQHLEHTEGKPNPGSAADATEASTPLSPVEPPNGKAKHPQQAKNFQKSSGVPTAKRSKQHQDTGTAAFSSGGLLSVKESPESIASSGAEIKQELCSPVGPPKRRRKSSSSWRGYSSPVTHVEDISLCSDLLAGSLPNEDPAEAKKRCLDDVLAAKVKSIAKRRKRLSDAVDSFGMPTCTPSPHPFAKVQCIMLSESAWDKLKANGSGTILRSYALSKLPQRFYVIVSLQSGNTNAHVGQIEVSSVDTLNRAYHLQKHDCNIQETMFWSDRFKQGKWAYAWSVSKVRTKLEHGIVKFPTSKFRNRHFQCEKFKLDQGAAAMDVPKPSLFSTPAWFLKLLPPDRYGHLRSVAEHLDGTNVYVGTACSGSEVCITAIQGLLDKMNEEFGATRPPVCYIYIYMKYRYTCICLYLFRCKYIVCVYVIIWISNQLNSTLFHIYIYIFTYTPMF